MNHSEKAHTLKYFMFLCCFITAQQVSKKFSSLISLRLTNYPCNENRRKHHLADRFNFCYFVNRQTKFIAKIVFGGYSA